MSIATYLRASCNRGYGFTFRTVSEPSAIGSPRAEAARHGRLAGWDPGFINLLDPFFPRHMVGTALTLTDPMHKVLTVARARIMLSAI